MRKAKPKKRVILPDPVFSDVKVTKFVNHLMYDGKKSVAYTIFYTALDTVKEKLSNEEKSSLEIWKKALDNILGCRFIISFPCNQIKSNLAEQKLYHNMGKMSRDRTC